MERERGKTSLTAHSLIFLPCFFLLLQSKNVHTINQTELKNQVNIAIERKCVHTTL